MAIYHCSVQIIGRNAGRSSVAAAAYRAGEKLVNEYDGIEHDFTRKNWVEFTEIILPDNAPKEYSDRSTLWNAVEMAEKSKDAQLCREFELALPIEMTREQQIKVVEQFVKDKLTVQGMIADIAIHNPPVTNDRHQPIDKKGNVTKDVGQMQFINPHAHILVTVRPLDEQGKWQKKSEIEYLCKRGNEEKGFTASEFKKAKEEGWEKQYKFADGKKKVWLTAEEGKNKELERISRSPKSSKYGRKNKIVEYWNSKDRIFEWRQYWETVVNNEFASNKSEVRIDSRSFKNQGRGDELPTLHMGTSAINMEKRAEREIREGVPETLVERSDIGNINKQIQEHNKFVRELKEQITAMIEKAKNFTAEISRKLGGIRAKLIGNNYEKLVLTYKLNHIKSGLELENERLEKYRVENEKTDKANTDASEKIKKLKREIDKCLPLQFMKKNDLRKQVQELQEQIEDRKEYITSFGRMFGYADEEEYQMARSEYIAKSEDYNTMQRTMDSLQMDTNNLISEYKMEMLSTSIKNLEKTEEIKLAKEEMECVTKKELQKKYKYDFDEEKYTNACNITDKELEVDNGIRQKSEQEGFKLVSDDTNIVEKPISERNTNHKKSLHR